MLVAPLFQRQVARYPEQKGSQAAACGIEQIGPAEEREENILRDVLGRGGRVGHSPREAVNRLFVFEKGRPELTLGHLTLTDNYREGTEKIRLSVGRP